MYKQRIAELLGPVPTMLAQEGLVTVPDVYTVSDLAQLNSAMNPVFATKTHERRAYLRPDDMTEIGIFSDVVSPSMLDLLFSIMPDPVIYHLHAYEIAGGNSRSHIFDEKLGGWHRDPDSYYFAGDPTHVSVFVYLSNVGTNDGAFEFAPQIPEAKLRVDSAVASMTGDAGFSFAWNRSFYHRASPNSGPRRRRLLKISIQRNEFPSIHLKQPFFERAISAIPYGNPKIDLLLGRFQGKSAPDDLAPAKPIVPGSPRVNASIGLTIKALDESNVKDQGFVGGVTYYD